MEITRENDLALLQEANKSLQAMDIKGKDYIPVNERIKAFRYIYPRGLIKTEILSLADGVVTMKAEIYDDQGQLLATGHAQEKETSSFINKTSFIENCETSVVGRALGNIGLGLDFGFASFEEVANAKLQQNENKAISEADWKTLKSLFSKEEITAMMNELGISKGKEIPAEYARTKITERMKSEAQEQTKEFY